MAANDHDSEPQPAADEETDRRAMLSKLTIGAGLALGGAVAVGPLSMAISPVVRGDSAREQDGWTAVGPIDRFVVGGAPQRVVLRRDKQDGWLLRRQQSIGSVLVQRVDATTFHVFSAVCPHLGCAVGVSDAGDHYACPCHRSSFMLDGTRRENADGATNPAPRPLDALAARVADGQLLVEWVRYRPGTADQVRIA